MAWGSEQVGSRGRAGSKLLRRACVHLDLNGSLWLSCFLLSYFVSKGGLYMHLPTCVWAHTFVRISMCETSLHFAYMRMSSAPRALFGMPGGGEPEGSQLSGTRAQTGWGRAPSMKVNPALLPASLPWEDPCPHPFSVLASCFLHLFL